jgi:hypothetical protein
MELKSHGRLSPCTELVICYHVCRFYKTNLRCYLFLSKLAWFQKWKRKIGLHLSIFSSICKICMDSNLQDQNQKGKSYEGRNLHEIFHVIWRLAKFKTLSSLKIISSFPYWWEYSHVNLNLLPNQVRSQISTYLCRV